MTILQNKINESNYSMTDVAHELGVSTFTVYRKITGRTLIKRGELKIISTMLKLTSDEEERIQEELRKQHVRFKDTAANI